MAFISRKRPNETIEVNEDLGDDNVAPLKMKKRQFPLEFKLQIVSQAKELNNRKVAKMHGLDESCVRLLTVCTTHLGFAIDTYPTKYFETNLAF